jgi:phosphatidylglycerol:prolipoprotein diacylglycerol transferase
MGTLAIIWWVKTKKQQFEGQLFFIYIMMYATGRAIIENFRGDVQRGFVFDGLLSHSQFISMMLIAGVLLLYWQKFRQSKRISS